jgi:uncharacterized protein (DUF1330 family)
MVAYAVVDVDVHDIGEFLNYQKKIASLLNAAGGRYLARGGEFRIYAGDYEPGRLLLMEFPSLEAMDHFYKSDTYKSLEAERDACSNCRIVAVKGL